MEITDISRAQGHWLLAKTGKKVLRPGGRELTEKLVCQLHINQNDKLIEFAPGLGYTARLALNRRPQSYTGVDADSEAIERLKTKITGNNISFINGNARQVDLESSSATKVYGEAMLTMNADHRKAEIIKEAYRLLVPGGLYAIHELGLAPDNLPAPLKDEIQRELAKAIRVNARPLTMQEWKTLLRSAGFEIVFSETNKMHLLEAKRIISDEGFFRALKIGWNIAVNPPARKRILEMRRVFRKYEQHMTGLVIVAKK